MTLFENGTGIANRGWVLPHDFNIDRVEIRQRQSLFAGLNFIFVWRIPETNLRSSPEAQQGCKPRVSSR